MLVNTCDALLNAAVTTDNAEGTWRPTAVAARRLHALKALAHGSEAQYKDVQAESDEE